MKKKTLPKLSAVMLVLGVLAILALFTRGGLSNAQPDMQGEEQLLGDVAGHRNILDRGYRELAVSFKMKSLYARPLEIIDIDKTAALLAGDLGLDARKLARELKSERSFVWVGRRLSESRADTILAKGIKGVYAVAEAQRFYPARRSGAHVVGFLEESNGLAGVEFSYGHLLHRDLGANGDASTKLTGHLLLTLDLRIQEVLADGLGKLLRETEAVSGTGILMNYKTGAVLAMVSLPDYDSNYYWDSSSVERQNRAIAGRVEVGGFQYLFGLAAAYGDVGGDGQGSLASLKMDLRLDNLPPRSRRSKWFEQSGDNLLSPEFRGWPEGTLVGDEPTALVERLGFFRKTGIDLPGADNSSPRQSGQTTPLKLLTAFAELVNGGSGITPHLGKAIINSQSGRRNEINHPVKPGLVKPSTSKKIVALLTGVSRSKSAALFLESMRAVDLMSVEEGGEEKMPGGQSARYQTVMIGVTPHSEPGLVLLVALDQAVIDSDKKTPMRSMGEAMIGQLLSLAGAEVDAPSLEVMAASEKLIYGDWLNSQVVASEDMIVAAVPGRRDVMPDLIGLSLRKALRNMQQLGLKVEVVGSGRVAAQEPAPGLMVRGDECRLTLLVDS